MLDIDRPKSLTRTRSDVGKLKTEVIDFLDEWNTKDDFEYISSPSNKTCQKRQAWMEAVDVLLRPVMNLCKRHKQANKWRSESNIRSRQSSQSSDQQPCPLIRRRAMSESSLQFVNHVSCVEFSPEQKKKVCFSAPTSSACKFEKRCCLNQPRRSILLQKSCISAKPDYMDYATFKAWRRGSRMSIDVCSMPLKLKDCKERKFEQILKKFMSSCVNQMNAKSIPDM